MRVIPPSELIVNADGSVFHLHLRPEQLARTVILVGDPGRVERVASYFDRRECEARNREFVSVTGSYRGERMTVLSTGIGTDNIDIVVNELDALANIDFASRTEKAGKTALRLVRLGTCGAIQPDLRIGDRILSRISVGFDGLLNFYAGRDAVCDREMERAFVEHTGWSPALAAPYFVRCSDALAGLFADATVEGMTASAPGFYAPQGRRLRLDPADGELNAKIETFRHGRFRFTNFEMEGSALAGLARLMGHEAVTICTVIAQRVALDMETDYRPFVDKMIAMSLEKLAGL
ncbi:nucleoside phosphorylase [uncultured Alistipes sp.]|uniref:nucleoside phosphorylase n=1 Tax=uncultured Alistipes sp. TaxID=538949 RepID=UPI00261307D2|nr:nucleoside phosphorylase [uncultured Alistipes sp.]